MPRMLGNRTEWRRWLEAASDAQLREAREDAQLIVDDKDVYWIVREYVQFALADLAFEIATRRRKKSA